MLNTLVYDIYTSDIMIMIQADIPLSKTTGSREKSVLNTIEFTFTTLTNHKALVS